MATSCRAAYRARNPRATPLYRLFETHFEEVRGQWEDRFERRFGFWRGFVDEQVLRYLDCGLYENGFARIRCPECAEEYLLAFSCKTRELCPSCAAKRSAATAALLAEDVIEEIGHAQWVFVIPKMLRPYFLHHRELLGGLSRAAWETVLELMRAAVDDETFRPGMVAVVQTAGDMANFHPHVHALIPRGGWSRDGVWIPVPFVDEHSAELLFRHKVMRLLQDEGLLSDERTELLLSWRHTGFSWSRFLWSLRQALPLRIGADCHPRFAAKTSSLDSSLARSSPQPGVRRARGPGGGGTPRSLHYAAADQPRADGVGWGGGGPVQEEGRA